MSRPRMRAFMGATLALSLIGFGLSGCEERPIPGMIERACGRTWLWTDGKGHRWVSNINWQSAADPIAPTADLNSVCGSLSPERTAPAIATAQPSKTGSTR